MNFSPLKQALLNLPKDATQAIVSNVFINELIKTLGFDSTEVVPNYITGAGAACVDYALRQNKGADIFVQSKTAPHILIEVKGRNTNLAPESAQYKAACHQLKNYLSDSKCHSVRWGIVVNGDHIQLFRKHGKVIHPATVPAAITPDNIDEVVSSIKGKIDNPSKALTVAVYNNKGGVGKTTTTINLAGTLTLHGKKVLAVDFDHNQQDLSGLLKQDVSDDSVFSWLYNDTVKEIPDNLIIPFRYAAPNGTVLTFDVIPSDRMLRETDEAKVGMLFDSRRFKKALEPLKSRYDYILIDASPNWRLYSRSAVYAADVVLIPTKHNSVYSLDNAAKAITNFIPETQKYRKDGGPIPLPIFFNGENISDAARRNAINQIVNIINTHRQDLGNPIDLTPYFFPKYTHNLKNFEVFHLQSNAYIAECLFSGTPAVYKYKVAYQFYFNLAKEYFLD